MVVFCIELSPGRASLLPHALRISLVPRCLAYFQHSGTIRTRDPVFSAISTTNSQSHVLERDLRYMPLWERLITLDVALFASLTPCAALRMCLAFHFCGRRIRHGDYLRARRKG